MTDIPSSEEQKTVILDEITRIAPYLQDPQREDFGMFRDFFADLLPRQTEISFCPHDESVGIMTRGSGKIFEEKVRDYLGKSGMAEEALEMFDSLCKYFPDINMLIKRDFDEKRTFEFTLYWQYLVPIKLLLRLARRYNFKKSILAFFSDTSILMRATSVFLGVGFVPPDNVGFKIFFSSPLKKSGHFLTPALSALMGRIMLPADIINYFISFDNYLTQAAVGNLFTSLSFSDSPPTSVKLDYEIIPPEHVFQIMKALDIPPQQEERLRNALKIMEMGKVTYLGIKFVRDRLPLLKFYLDRRYSAKNSENPENLADFIKNTIWR